MTGEETQRLDKWLWAARFFKTRSLAAEAVAGGKVHVDGQRVKPARALRRGQEVRIHKGEWAATVTVVGFSAARRPAREAQMLYEESAESIRRREEAALLHRAMSEPARDAGRPTKRDRRKRARLIPD